MTIDGYSQPGSQPDSPAGDDQAAPLIELDGSRAGAGADGLVITAVGADVVEMKAEMDVVVLISNCPQLNNPCNAYNPTPIRLLVWDDPTV